MKKKMKDRPGLLDDANRLAGHGRRGDNTVGHLTTGEIVIPKSAQTPALMGLLAETFAGTGHDIGRYTVGGSDDSRNPKTGAREFSDQGVGEAGSGGGAETGFGGGFDSVSDGGKDEGARATEAAGAAAPGAGPFGGATAEHQGYTPQTVEYFAQDRPFMGHMSLIGDKISGGISRSLTDMANNPARTAANLGIGMIPGVGLVNSLVGMVAGQDKTLGAGLVGGFNSLTGQTQAALAEPDAPEGPPGPDTTGGPSGTADNYSTAVKPAPMASGEQPAQVAQEALRRAFMVNPELLNMWTGNKFTAAGTAGRPNAYNQWQGNQLMRPPVFPGLIG